MLRWHISRICCEVILCPGVFHCKKDLEHHLRTFHSKSKPRYTCSGCGRLFNVIENLLRHSANWCSGNLGTALNPSGFILTVPECSPSSGSRVTTPSNLLLDPALDSQTQLQASVFGVSASLEPDPPHNRVILPAKGPTKSRPFKSTGVAPNNRWVEPNLDSKTPLQTSVCLMPSALGSVSVALASSSATLFSTQGHTRTSLTSTFSKTTLSSGSTAVPNQPLIHRTLDNQTQLQTSMSALLDSNPPQSRRRRNSC
jgi:hypothetical protein